MGGNRTGKGYRVLMAHPLMYHAHDPVLTWFREIALSLPEAKEKVSHGRPTFFTTKIFAYFGGSRKLQPTGMEQHPHAMLVRPEPVDAEVLLESEDAFVPAYLGPYGWIGLELDSLDEDEVRGLLVDSFRSTAPARLVRLIES